MQLFDVFAGIHCRGNRAAVVLLDAPLPDPEMQALARHLGAPATAFVQSSAADGAYPARWFAPAREIALCGHGALAAGHVLLATGGEEMVRLRASDGRMLAIRRTECPMSHELAIPAILTEPRDWADLGAALGKAPQAVRWNPAGYALALFASPQEVVDLAPDPAALAGLGDVQVIASAAGSLAGMGAGFTSRVFSGSGNEDAATGSAHAVLAPYWSQILGRDRIAAHQASLRGGWFECRVSAGTVWLRGQCVAAD